MNRDITRRLQEGERFLLDGATGSELQRRQVDLSVGCYRRRDFVGIQPV